MPLANTLPTGSKPSTPGLAPSTITRVTLASGYRAYHPSGDSSSSSSLAAQPPKPQKTVRFVKGHITIPNIPYSQLRSPAPTNHHHHPTPTTHTHIHYTPHDDPSTDSSSSPSLSEEEDYVLPTPGTPPTPALARKHNPHHPHHHHHHKNTHFERLERPDGSTAAWRKTPRFRGSGFVQVLDEPVAEGVALAGDEAVGLPSDGWRGVVRRVGGVQVVRERGEMNGKEGVGLGVDMEGVFSMRDVGGKGAWGDGEGGYVVRVVAAGGRRARWGRVTSSSAAAEEVVGEEESAALTEGSDSEDGDEYDFVNDFSLEEAEGWVPVMVAEEDHGDDWMSLTGSWIKMGDAPGDVKKVQEKVVAG